MLRQIRLVVRQFRVNVAVASVVGALMIGCNSGTPGRSPGATTAAVPLPADESSVPNITVAEGQGRVDTTRDGGLVTLHAVPDAGWAFAGWINVSSVANPVQVLASDAVSIGVRFVPYEPSADGDFVPDEIDECPNSAVGVWVDAVGCSIRQRDGDLDGVLDAQDLCDGTLRGVPVTAFGCIQAEFDGDLDGVDNNFDGCPETEFGENVNVLGCSTIQFDLDLDGVPNPFDVCAETASGARADLNGCASEQASGGFGTNPIPPAGAMQPPSASPSNVPVAWRPATRWFFQGAGLVPDDGYITPELLEFTGTQLTLAQVTPNETSIAAAFEQPEILNTEFGPGSRVPLFQVDVAPADNGGILLLDNDVITEIVQYESFSFNAAAGQEARFFFCYRLIDEYSTQERSAPIDYFVVGTQTGDVSEDGLTITWASVSGTMTTTDYATGERVVEQLSDVLDLSTWTQGVALFEINSAP